MFFVIQTWVLLALDVGSSSVPSYSPCSVKYENGGLHIDCPFEINGILPSQETWRLTLV